MPRVTRIRIIAALCSGTASLALNCAPAHAQTEPASRPDAPSAEEIIVTAQRTETRLERTPVAISVISSETLARANITTQADLPAAAPGLLVRAGQTNNQINYVMRGQSLDAYSYARPGVVPYINEVALPTSAVSSGFYDLQGIQVLKGPQGTLFGRNATGGAVLFTTQRPTEELGGYASASAGNYDFLKFEGALNVPLAEDALLARVAGVYQKRRGFQYNLYNDLWMGSYERYAIRGSISAKLGESIKNDTIIEFQHMTGRNLLGDIYSLQPNLSPLPAAALYEPATSDALASAFTGGRLGAGNYAAYIASHPGTDPLGIAHYFSVQKARGPYKINIESTGELYTRSTSIINITTAALGDDTNWKNIFGYTQHCDFTNSEADGTPYGIANMKPIVNYPVTCNTARGPNGRGALTEGYMISDEMQVSGKAAANKLQYVVGVFYSKERMGQFGNSNFLEILGGGTPVVARSQLFTTDYAAYGQGTLDISDWTGVAGLSITGGLRYTHEDVRVVRPGDDPLVIASPIAPAGQSYDQARSIEAVSWTFGLQDQVNPDLLVYLASRRSYKMGGYNATATPVIGFSETTPRAGSGYRTEVVTDVELGAKFAGRLGEMPARLNLAAYYDWIKNSQRTAYVIVNGGPTTTTVNVAAAQVYGFELDGQIDPTPWLRIGGALNYTHAKFTNPTAYVGGILSSLETYPDTPRWSGTAFAEIHAPVTERLTAIARAEMFGQSSMFYSSSANVNTTAVIPGYALANFRLGLEDDAAGWSLTANLKNAFNRTYYVGGNPIGQLIGINTIIPGEPRMFTVEARLNF